jgi:hypothetical protein
MPIVEFENLNDEDLVLTVSPWGDEHKIPHLARVGIRYTLKAGEEDRCYTSVSENRFDFWCNADTYEIEVVSPSPYDRLLWSLAVGGWCGGPTHVCDLLPSTGMVGAKAFAKLVMLADGWLESEPLAQHHLDWIEEKFIEHLGPEAVSVDLLRPNLASAFDPDAPA